MASMVPPKKNAAYETSVWLVSRANTDEFQTNVTLAAGDVLVRQDSGDYDNIASLPVEKGTTGELILSLTASEMNGDIVRILFHDAAGDEWQDLGIVIPTVSRQIDDLLYLLSTVEGSYTVQDLLRLMSAALFGKASGGGTSTIKFRDLADAADRITATVDAQGNRTAMTLDAT